MTLASSRSSIQTGLVLDAESLASTSTTDLIKVTGVGTTSTTSKPSVPFTTKSDTDSYEVTGEEDLSEVLDLDYETFLKWATLRVATYREAVATFASVAQGHKESGGKHPPTVAESEWMAEAATGGLTKSYPFEAPLIQFVLEEKKSARH